VPLLTAVAFVEVVDEGDRTLEVPAPVAVPVAVLLLLTDARGRTVAAPPVVRTAPTPGTVEVRAAIGVVGPRTPPVAAGLVAPVVVAEIGFLTAAAIVADGATLALALTGVEADEGAGRTTGLADVVPALATLAFTVAAPAAAGLLLAVLLDDSVDDGREGGGDDTEDMVLTFYCRRGATGHRRGIRPDDGGSRQEKRGL
jgi:hypothetical protein